jgi:predicted dehydrogenase
VGDIATHIVDMARYLVGEIAAVNAVTRTYITERPIQNSTTDKLGASVRLSGVPTAPVDGDDEVITLLRFQDGAAAAPLVACV